MSLTRVDRAIGLRLAFAPAGRLLNSSLALSELAYVRAIVARKTTVPLVLNEKPEGGQGEGERERVLGD